MRQRTKELWVIPTVITMVTGILLGTGFMFLGQWLAGTPIRPSLSLGWLRLAVSASLPVWATLAVLLVAVVITGLFLRQRAMTAEEFEQKNSATQAMAHLEEQIARLNGEHAAEIGRLNSKEPWLHGVWDNRQTFWHLGRKGQEPMMQIGGWIDLSSSNAKEVIRLLAAYINGRRADLFMPVSVKPNQVNRGMVMLHIVPPLESDASKPFTATVVVEDQYNRIYELPVHTFRATPGQPPTLSPRVEGPVPVLHASWRGDSAWGWASAFPDEDPIYMICGDVTLAMDNVTEPVIVTGVEIEGAETLGSFNNFRLDPGQPETRGMQLYFRGKAPEGTDNYKVQLIFKDLRGNRYPTVEYGFRPLPVPERAGRKEPLDRRGTGSQ